MGMQSVTQYLIRQKKMTRFAFSKMTQWAVKDVTKFTTTFKKDCLCFKMKDKAETVKEFNAVAENHNWVQRIEVEKESARVRLNKIIITYKGPNINCILFLCDIGMGKELG